MTIDWERLDQLAQGTTVSITKETCELAEILVKEVSVKDNASMELAMQVAIWREAYVTLRREYNTPNDPESRRALGFSDVMKLQEENQKLKVKLSKARYAMISTGNMLREAAKQDD